MVYRRVDLLGDMLMALNIWMAVNNELGIKWNEVVSRII
jgi:hypothetical protein